MSKCKINLMGLYTEKNIDEISTLDRYHVISTVNQNSHTKWRRYSTVIRHTEGVDRMESSDR